MSTSVEEMLLKKRDKIKKMINLVTSVRDISDSLPALSRGTPGAVVESEPDLEVFARDVPEVRQPRSRFGRRRGRYYEDYHPNPFPMGGAMAMAGIHAAGVAGMGMGMGMGIMGIAGQLDSDDDSDDSDDYGQW